VKNRRPGTREPNPQENRSVEKMVHGRPPQRVRTGPGFLVLLAVLVSAAAVAPVTGLAAAAETVYETVLDNGVTVVVMPQGSDPPVASVQVWIAAGGADDPAGKEGLAHFFEHMV